MIDWHTHILPAMDDGSKDIDESISLLQMLSEQGITTTAVTPHFYANDESVDEFLDRRKSAYDALMQNHFDNMPKLLMGAEVRYYPGIGNLDDLDKLCISDTEILLLEMPFVRWTEYTVRELLSIANLSGVKIVLAHIERYLSMQNEEVWNKLYESGILMQVNASFFTDAGTRRKAVNLFKKGGIHLLGSDCHNIKHRPPHIGAAYEIIRRKFGDEVLSQFIEFGEALLIKK